MTPVDSSYITVPYAVAGAVAVASSLKVMAVPDAIVPADTASDAAVATEAKSTFDRFRLDAGRTASYFYIESTLSFTMLFNVSFLY